MADTDRRAYYTDEAVGYSHPTKADTINRLPVAFHDKTGRHLFSGGTTVASAATIAVPDDSNYFLVSGTTNISTVSAKSTGCVVAIKFTGSLKLINGANLSMPGDADLQVHSGDVVTLHEVTSGAWKCLGISRENGPIGGMLELDVVTHATNPTYQLTITADMVSAHDTSNRVINLLGVSLTADITVSGGNGLDTGTEANSTWYYVYVICNGDTVTGVKSLLSLSATAPTMPAGYIYKRRVGAVYNDSGGNFKAFRQHDCWVYFAQFSTDLSGGTATTFTTLSLTRPTTATNAVLMLSPSTSGDAWQLSWDGTNPSQSCVSGAGYIINVVCGLGVSGVLYYKRFSGTGNLTLYTSAYYDEIQ